MLGQKISLSKFETIEIMESMFQNHNVIKLEIKNRMKLGKFTNMWK